jgi:hypothetical protein
MNNGGHDQLRRSNCDQLLSAQPLRLNTTVHPKESHGAKKLKEQIIIPIMRQVVPT